MMSEMKYVVVESKEQGEQMFIFPKNINHNDFYDVLSYIKIGDNHNWTRPYRGIVSSGFTDGKTCYGRSESLQVDSRPEDTALLAAGGVDKQHF